MSQRNEFRHQGRRYIKALKEGLINEYRPCGTPDGDPLVPEDFEDVWRIKEKELLNMETANQYKDWTHSVVALLLNAEVLLAGCLFVFSSHHPSDTLTLTCDDTLKLLCLAIAGSCTWLFCTQLKVGNQHYWLQAFSCYIRCLPVVVEIINVL